MTTTSEVPHKYDTAFDGRGYLFDDSTELGTFRRRTIRLLKEQFDISEQPGERSLNPEGLWRRSIISWHAGAGQIYLDRKDSNPDRFRNSRGIDPWVKWELGLLPTVTSVGPAGAFTNATDLITTLGKLFLRADGAALRRWDGAAWVTVDMSAGEGVILYGDVTSDGTNLYQITTHGIHRSVDGAAATHYNDLTVSMANFTTIGFVNGRLMVSEAGNIYNVAGAGAAPISLGDTGLTEIVGFASGKTHLYTAGKRGDKSEIYKITIQPSGIGLTAPVMAGQLPDGELIYSIYGYLGFIFLGTNKGVRFCQVDDDGDLTIGSPIGWPTMGIVKAFEGQDRFVWFTIPSFSMAGDVPTPGLGRIDLNTFTDADNLIPAYASDIMAPSGLDVRSVATYGSQRVFTTTDTVWIESGLLETTGKLDSGLITYGLTDTKIPVRLTTIHRPLAGSHEAFISVDEGPFISIGTHATANEVKDAMTGIADIPGLGDGGSSIEIRTKLNAAIAIGVGPQITQLLLESYPAPSASQRGEIIAVPVLVNEAVNPRGQKVSKDPDSDYSYLRGLIGKRIEWQVGDEIHDAFVEEVELAAYNQTQDRKGYNGTAVVTMKLLEL